MEKTTNESLIGKKISFRTADGKKHYGIIEDVVPQLTGGTILSVKCSALDKTLTLTEEQLNVPRK